jgi:SulP family sulfate permease
MVRRLANFKQFHALVVVLTDVPVMDFTSCRALDDMISDTLAVIRKVFLVCRRPKLKTYLDKQGIFKKLELDSIHSERSTALCAAVRAIELDPDVCKAT